MPSDVPVWLRYSTSGCAGQSAMQSDALSVAVLIVTSDSGRLMTYAPNVPLDVGTVW